jgi:hypothetical protein
MCCNILIEKLEANTDCFTNKTAAEEKGRKFHLLLPKGETACRIKVDKCLVFSSKTKKCDFLFKRCKTDDYFFVELKGQDITQAFLQLTTTVKLLKETLGIKKENCYAFISASKVPRMTTRSQNFEENFKKGYGQELRISSSNPEWRISENL